MRLWVAAIPLVPASRRLRWRAGGVLPLVVPALVVLGLADLGYAGYGQDWPQDDYEKMRRFMIAPISSVLLERLLHRHLRLC